MDDLQGPATFIHLTTAAELQEMLAAALEAIPAAALVLGASGLLLAANRAGLSWLTGGVSRDACLRAAARGEGPAELALTRVGDSGAALVLVHAAPTESAPPSEPSSRPAPPPSSSPGAAWRFTPRERDILTLLLEGRSNRAIGAALTIAERTVETHLTSMFLKAGVTSRAELVARVRDR